jgi:ribosomal protein RSM22 (predicted rRNA methylase)
MPFHDLSQDIKPIHDASYSRLVNDMGRELSNMYSSLIINKREDRLHYQTKSSPSDREKKKVTYDEFGYYYNAYAYELFSLIKHFDCKSIIDLGCGAGIILKVLLYLYPELRIAGIENEPELHQRAMKLLNFTNPSNSFHYNNENIALGDITSLDDMKICKKCDAAYFWEPISKEQKANLFINTLAKSTKIGTWIFYLPAGPIQRELNMHCAFDYVGNYKGYIVYRRIKMRKKNSHKSLETLY